MVHDEKKTKIYDNAVGKLRHALATFASALEEDSRHGPEDLLIREMVAGLGFVAEVFF